MLVANLILYFITMTKKHYIMVANWLVELKSLGMLDKYIVDLVCADLLNDNPKFNVTKFLSYIKDHAN